MSDQENLQEKKFDVRLKESKIWTHMMVAFLKKQGHITDFRQATAEEDKNDLIDYWFRYAGQEEYVPVAFKLRIDPAKRDIPVVFSQPFYGIDGAKTVLGRDYRCLTEGQVQQYYVAVKNGAKEFCEVYRISKEKLGPKIQLIVKSWKEDDATSSMFVQHAKLTETRNSALLKNLNWGKGARKIWATDDGEIWWQKNHNENFSKVNLYVPENFKEESFSISPKVYQTMLVSYKEYMRSKDEA